MCNTCGNTRTITIPADGRCGCRDAQDCPHDGPLEIGCPTCEAQHPACAECGERYGCECLTQVLPARRTAPDIDDALALFRAASCALESAHRLQEQALRLVADSLGARKALEILDYRNSQVSVAEQIFRDTQAAAAHAFRVLHG